MWKNVRKRGKASFLYSFLLRHSLSGGGSIIDAHSTNERWPTLSGPSSCEYNVLFNACALALSEGLSCTGSSNGGGGGQAVQLQGGRNNRGPLTYAHNSTAISSFTHLAHQDSESPEKKRCLLVESLRTCTSFCDASSCVLHVDSGQWCFR